MTDRNINPLSSIYYFNLNVIKNSYSNSNQDQTIANENEKIETLYKEADASTIIINNISIDGYINLEFPFKILILDAQKLNQVIFI